MKELKNAVLTLRTTDEVKRKLEDEADSRGWVFLSGLLLLLRSEFVEEMREGFARLA